MSENIQIEAGSIYTGKVIKIKPFGAIVSLPGNTHGLVHISHVSKSYVQNVEEFLSVGDEVTVKVLTNDPRTGKIALSIKDAITETQENAPEAEQRSEDNYRPRQNTEYTLTFEDKVKDWLRASNERQAGLSKRNKRR